MGAVEASTPCRRKQIGSDPRPLFEIAPTAQDLEVSDARSATSTQRDDVIEFEVVGITALATPTAISLPHLGFHVRRYRSGIAMARSEN